MLWQTGESWNRCVKPKAAGAWNLDAASRDLKHLTHFVCFSSIVAAAGNAGDSAPQAIQCLKLLAARLSVCMTWLVVLTCHEQGLRSHAIRCACSPRLKLFSVVPPGQGNYGYGNMAASELCRARRALGLPAIAFGAGPISGVGYVADNLDLVSSAGRLSPARLVCCQYRTCLQLASQCCVSASPDRAQRLCRSSPGGSCSSWHTSLWMKSSLCWAPCCASLTATPPATST